MSLKETLLSSFMVLENELAEKSDTLVHDIRRKAINEFESLGFPSTKEENWKYTSLVELTKEDYSTRILHENHLEYKDVKKFLIHEIDSYQLIFIDGVFSSWLSNTGTGAFKMGCLCHELDYDTEIAKGHFNKLAEGVDSISALNTAFSVEGGMITIPDNVVVDKPIQLVYFSSEQGKSMMYQPRNLVVVGKNAEVKIIERYQNLSQHKVFNNVVTEIYVGENARVHWYKIQNDEPNASLIDSTFVEQKRYSYTNFVTCTLGGKFVRNNLQFFLKEEYAEANMKGITLLSKNQFADHHTFVDHQAPNCQSNELYKGIFDEYSKGVFNGKIMVRPHAQKTNAFQQNNNILLNDTASIDTKPELEIYADDVKCSHGCTVGQLDNEALFYLRSRGIPEKEAIALLLFAFKHDVLQEVQVDAVKKRLNKIIGQKLGVGLDFDL
jgi:Fe-S cluster assembly protein SufD